MSGKHVVVYSHSTDIAVVKGGVVAGKSKKLAADTHLLVHTRAVVVTVGVNVVIVIVEVHEHGLLDHSTDGTCSCGDHVDLAKLSALIKNADRGYISSSVGVSCRLLIGDDSLGKLLKYLVSVVSRLLDDVLTCIKS